MTWTSSTLSVKDAASSTQTIVAYTDGTNFSFGHVILDNTGAIIAPATSTLQTTMNTNLSSILTACQAATPAGTNVIGKVSIDQTTPGTTNAVSNPNPRIVTGATTTRPADTTAYTQGDLIANSTTAGSVVPQTIAVASGNDVKGFITGGIIKSSATSVTSRIVRLHLYNAQPTVTNGDNGTWLSIYSGYIGTWEAVLDKAFSDAVAGRLYPLVGSVMPYTPVSGAQTLYYLLEARGAFTPISGEVFTPILEMQQ